LPSQQLDTRESQLQAKIANQINSTSSSADVNIQYRYERGPNGELIAVAATVTITEDQASSPQSLATNNNRATTIEDPVSLSPEAQSEIGLTDSEKAYLQRLQAADAAVRNHEGLHFRAAGGLGQLPEYQTVTGPDGNQYAVAGSVNVSSTQGVDAERAAREAETLGIAATAPADASAADLSAAREFGRNTVNNNQNQLAAENSSPVGNIVNLIA